MRAKWLVLAVLVVTILVATGCASSGSNRRYGYYDPYGTVYGQGYPRVYRTYPPRDYRWERQRRARQEWYRRQQLQNRQRHERRRDRGSAERQYRR